MLPDAGLPAPMTCTDYLDLETRDFNQELPYIAPAPPTDHCHVYVESPFMALAGESDPQPDNTTCVWAAPMTYHRLDGTTELGAVGRRDPADEACVWVTPVRIDP